jgi:hypothetical protein
MNKQRNLARIAQVDRTSEGRPRAEKFATYSHASSMPRLACRTRKLLSFCFQKLNEAEGVRGVQNHYRSAKRDRAARRSGASSNKAVYRVTHLPGFSLQ